MMKNFVLLFSVLFLAACGKSNQAENIVDRRQIHTISDGELNKSVEAVLSSEWTESCDHVASPMMRELTQALDSKVSEINQFASHLPPSKTFKMVPFGSSQLKDYVSLPESKDEWTTDAESWTGVYALYLENKDKPMNRAWLQLNAGVRSLILNDQKRVLYGVNQELHHDSGNKLESLKSKIDACVLNLNCILPAYSKEDDQFVDGVSFYSYYRSKLAKTNDRAVLVKFQKRVEGDLGDFGFELNSSIKVTKNGTSAILNLSFDGSVFTPEQKNQLQGYIESIWNSGDLSVKIQWQDLASNIFKIFFDLGNPGERSYVMFHKQEVHLFPFTRTRSVAHETGHVLGFPDHYYPTWDSENCVYLTESNSGDLMSDSAGKVTISEWEMLKSKYIN